MEINDTLIAIKLYRVFSSSNIYIANDSLAALLRLCLNCKTRGKEEEINISLKNGLQFISDQRITH